MPHQSLQEYEDFMEAIEFDLLCNETYCPFYIEHHNSPSNSNCEGRWCEEAWANFCSQNEREYET